MRDGIYVSNKFALTLVGVITVMITLLFVPVLMSWMSNATTADLIADLQQRGYTAFADADDNFDVPGDLEVDGDITAGGSYYGDGSNLTGISGDPVISIAADNSSTQAKNAATYVCDGEDDQVQFELAHDAAITNGSTKAVDIYVCPGTYIFSDSVDLSDDAIYDVTIHGSANSLGTKIILEDGISAVPIFNVGTPTAGALSYSGRVSFRNLWLDGNKSGTSGTANIVNMYGNLDTTVDECLIQNASWDALHVERAWTLTIKNSWLENNDNNGLSVKSTSNRIAQNVHINRNSFRGNVAGDIYLVNTSSTTTTHSLYQFEISSNHFGSPRESIVYFQGGLFKEFNIHDNIISAQGSGINSKDMFTFDRQNGVIRAPMTKINIHDNIIDADNWRSVYRIMAASSQDYNDTVNYINIHDNIIDLGDDSPMTQYEFVTAYYEYHMAQSRIFELNQINITDLKSASPTYFKEIYLVDDTVITTFNYTPPYPVRIGYSFAGSMPVNYSIKITGVNNHGNLVTELFAVSSGTTSNAFVTLQSVNYNEVQDATSATLSVGITEVVGLPGFVSFSGDIANITKDGVPQTLADGDIDYDYDTYDMSTIGTDGTNDFTIWFRNPRDMILE